MELNEYQEAAHKTAVYPLQHSQSYAVLGLTNEAGEVAGVLKKFYRGDYDFIVCQEKILKELGDVLWYAAEVATVFGFSLDEVARTNIDKLTARQSAGTLKGSGDDR